MALEDLTGSDKYLAALNPAWPTAEDGIAQGDDHIRGIKNVLINTFGPLEGPFEPDPQPVIVQGFVSMIQAFHVAAIPAQWLPCDGRTIQAADYPELVEWINPGQSSAVLPDLRAMFLRGWSEGNGVDPGGPRAPGSYQADDIEYHQHPAALGTPTANPAASAGYSYMTDGGNTQTLAAGGAESRPKNVAVVWAMYAGRAAP